MRFVILVTGWAAAAMVAGKVAAQDVVRPMPMTIEISD